MKQPSENKTRYFLPVRMMIVMFIIFSIVVVANSAFTGKNNFAGSEENDETNSRDSIESVKAFAEVYKVLMHPRCMNLSSQGRCTTAGR